MTRRDYELLTHAMRVVVMRAIARESRPDVRRGIVITISILSVELYAANPRFDQARFKVECGIGPDSPIRKGLTDARGLPD